MTRPGSSSTRSTRGTVGILTGLTGSWELLGLGCRAELGGGCLRRLPIGRWQRDRKGAPGAGTGRRAHLAAVRLDDPSDQRQAESVAVNLLRDGVRAAVERLEDVRK